MKIKFEGLDKISTLGNMLPNSWARSLDDANRLYYKNADCITIFQDGSIITLTSYNPHVDVRIIQRGRIIIDL